MKPGRAGESLSGFFMLILLFPRFPFAFLFVFRIE